MTEVEEYLETQRALDKNGKPDESVKAYKITNKLHSGTTDYYQADAGTSILMGEILLYFRNE